MRGAAARGAESAAPFPWDEVIAHGLGVLRLHPDAFWALTPRELGCLLAAGRGGRGAEPPGRAELARLLDAFPDTR